MDPEVTGFDYPATEAFEASAEKLLSNPDYADDFKPWAKFFHLFGTHFTSSVDFGGKMLYEQTITERSQQTIKEAGQDVSAAAEVGYSGMVASASVSASVSQSKTSGSDVSSMSSEFDVKIYVFGGIPPPSGANTDAGFSEWSSTVHDRPMPVRYDLTPIYMMPQFAAVENGTVIAKAMTREYFELNGVDPDEIMNEDPQAKVLKQLSAGKKLTFEHGNCLQSDNKLVKLDVSSKGELRLTYKRYNNMHIILILNNNYRILCTTRTSKTD